MSKDIFLKENIKNENIPMNNLRIAFAGTPQFAVPTLELLIQNHYKICAVLTQPDRASGRGQQVHRSPIKVCAQQHQLPVLQYTTLKTVDVEQSLRALDLDILVVVAYGLVLPKNILMIPRLGCLNVHASLLPRWRGAAPIQHAILCNDRLTGISIMRMDEGLDTGPVYFQAPYVLAQDITTPKLHDDLAHLGAQSLIYTLHLLKCTSYQFVPKLQHVQFASHAKKITKEDGQIDWKKAAEEILRQIHAYQPWPGAYSYIDQQVIKIFAANVIETQHNPRLEDVPVILPGTILQHTKTAIHVACGQGILALTVLQLPNKKAVNVSALLNAHANLFAVGKRFEMCVAGKLQ